MSPKSAPRDKRAIRSLVYKIIALILIPIIVFSTISHIESLSDRQIADLLEIFNFSKFGTPLNSALIIFILLLFGFFAFFPLIRLIQKFFSALTGKYFVISLAALAVLGAVAALYIPSYTNWFKPDTQQSTSSTQNGQGSGNQQNQSSKDPSSDLRLHLLYITGGIIAVLGLIETNRKNSQDHIRQVHAARRDRYIEAVDKLSSEDAPVRLGGVYALVGLVDEWLDDDNIDEETRIKEGQIIINNLCSYIRSPFTIAPKVEIFEVATSSDGYDEQQFIADQAALREEQDVRRSIFVEISKRSSRFNKNEKGNMVPIPGPWSNFDFDFSRAPIFYPLNHLTIERGNFLNAKLYAGTNFNSSIFIGAANFSGANFTRDANFSGAFFTHHAYFLKANFARDANFSKATFTNDVIFSRTTFTHNASFFNAKFIRYADFTNGVNFRRAIFTHNTSFFRRNFPRYIYFTNSVNFRGATFTHNADFRGATFTHKADFHGVTFTRNADFRRATFTRNADFRRATFTQRINFRNALFENYEPLFAGGEERAKFSVRPSQEDYIFSVRSGSKPIPPGDAELDGIERQIPVGTVLFDPDSGRTSEPAK